LNELLGARRATRSDRDRISIAADRARRASREEGARSHEVARGRALASAVHLRPSPSLEERPRMNTRSAISLALLCTGLFGCADAGEPAEAPEAEAASKVPAPTPDATGAISSISATGELDLDSDFFHSLGTNGRTCGSCHIPGQAFSISAEGMQKLFDATAGLDPVFRPVDGATSPLADVSTLEARRAAYRMLRTRGLIRVGLPIPANAEFELVAVDDPYGYASAAELSLFRRPLPSTNLEFLPLVMWDGRESGTSLAGTLATQANDATMGHAQAAAPLSAAVRDGIAAFELPLFTAQLVDDVAGRLDRDGARGGPTALSSVTRAPGRMDLYDAWIGLPVTDAQTARQAAIARGQELFNNRVSTAGPIPVRCGFCHQAADVGTSVQPLFFDLRLSEGFARTPDMPLYTLRNRTTGELRKSTDPGRALITGRWSDIGQFKVPGLRGLAARAPYFHNGSAATLRDVVQFYSFALGFQFTAAEADDLTAFLSAL
jgi:cytochrome c peroxidase